jgi:multidrug resistance efflux pump
VPPVPLRRGRTRWRIAALFLAVLTLGGTSVLAVRHGSSPTTPAAEPTPPRLVGIGYVDVEGGSVRLTPAQPGRVVEVAVHEGDTVKAGAVLLRLDDRSARFAVDQAEAALHIAEAHAARAGELSRQHPRQVAARRAAAEAAERRRAAAEHVLTQKQELRHGSLIGDAEVAVAQEQVKELRAVAQAAREQQAEAELTNPALGIREAEADVASCRARLGQARHVLNQCQLRAPEAGSVLRVSARRGEELAGPAGETAILFCPDRPRLIRVEIEQEFIGRVKLGLPAEIEDEADPDSRWSGRVAAVGGWFKQRRSIRQQPTQLEDVPVVECRIALEPAAAALRIGQRVQVRIGSP